MVLMEALDHQRKRLVLILVKQTQNFAPVCITTAAIVVYLLMAKKLLTLKSIKNNVNFPIQSYLESISNGFSATESKEVTLKGNVCNFSVDYNFIVKSDILNIQKYLIVKKNIK